MENEEVVTQRQEGEPAYDEYLPGPIQALVEWLLLIISTLVSFFQNRG